MDLSILKQKIVAAGLQEDFLGMSTASFGMGGRCLICCAPGCAVAGVTVN